MNINYRVGCIFGIAIGVVLLVIAIVEMVSQKRPHVGLIAWALWAILSSILIWVSRERPETQVQASDAENGQTIGFALSHVGAATILIIIVGGAIAGLLTAIVGI
jgi:hypothetical protein